MDGVELLKENIVATTLIARVQEHCQAYCMDEVFQIVTPPADGGNLINDDDTVDLFSHYSSLTRDQVLASMNFYRTFGQDYDLQNLTWSELFLANCCDEALRAKLDERMANQTIKGGPLYFFEMMTAIMTMTTEAATLMKEKLRTLTMQDFAGEDVHRAATLIRETVKRLEMIQDVPVDLPKQIISIFLTSSVPEFVRVFSTIESLHTVGGFTGGVVYDVPTLVEVAESTYVKLSTVWNVDPTDKPTSFISQNSKKVTCWGCGQEGHSLGQCPRTSKAEKKRIYDEMRKTKNSGEGGNNNSPSTTTTGGNQVNMNTANSGPSTTSLMRTPPLAGESQTKVIKGKTRKWCAVCKRWSLTHSTSEHRSGVGRNSQANTSCTPCDNATTSTSSSTGGPALNFAQQVRQQLAESRN